MLLTRRVKKQTPMYISRVMENPSDYGKKSEERFRTTLLKRISLHRLMDLKIDYAFKQLFGNEKNKDIMVVFLNAVLQRTGREKIRDISFLNIEAGGEYVDDKQSRLDLLVITNSGERINVEIQFTNKYDMIKRSIYYWAGIYRSPLKKRMRYKDLSTVISINILNFTLFKETDRFHTTFHLFEDEEKFKLTDIMEFHYIEMEKLIQAWKEEKLDPWNDVLARWLLMLGMIDHRNNMVYEDIFRELEEIAMKDEKLKEAFQHWQELSMTQEEYFAYEARLKHILDEESVQRDRELWEEEKKKFEEEMQQWEKERQQLEEEMQQWEKERQQLEEEMQQWKEKRRKWEKDKIEREKERKQWEEKSKEKEETLKRKEQKLKQREEEAKANIEQAKESKKKLTRNLLSMGMDIGRVVKATELSEEEVMEIKKELQSDEDL
jgi:predicted transposase/invertase (TIGR01784 family)